MSSSYAIAKSKSATRFLLLLLAGCSAGDADWPHYLGDQQRTHASDLREINTANVHRLEVAWRYDSGALAAGNSEIQTSPLVIDGVLFGLSASLTAFALSAATGEEIWRFEPALTGANQRGLHFWSDGVDRRLLYTAGRRLYALNADDGMPIAGFGAGGMVDLGNLQPRGAQGFFNVTTPGVVHGELLILGSRVGESQGAMPGLIVALSVRTGSVVWMFETIPKDGQPGSRTWPEQAWLTAGGANSWAGMALDEERGLVFVPTGSATPDFYGGDRHGDNLYANSLLALDARSGALRWHFQFVRHDLWDRDIPAPPTLVSISRDGEMIDAVAQITKTGHVFVFDRETGQSLFPIQEVEVPGSDVPGEWTAPTQPLPTAPPAFTRQTFEPTDRSHEARQTVLEHLEGLKSAPWAPPSLQGTLMYPDYDGGAEWGGAAFDAETGYLIVNANELAAIVRLIALPEGFSGRGVYLTHCAICHGAELEGTPTGPRLADAAERLPISEIFSLVRQGRGRMPAYPQLAAHEFNALIGHLLNPSQAEPQSDSRSYAFAGYQRVLDHDGYPGNSPPWGTLSAVDLAGGSIAWQVPLGENPELSEEAYVNAGTRNYGGPLVTAGGLVFIAATADEMIRAFDKRTGKKLWQHRLPHAGFATPATYSVDGRQYLVIAAGGGKLGLPSGASYVAYALP
jgi:quinoprotein glucose dehydrogenase